MLVAVLSDIHGNRHALEAVPDEVSTTTASDIWCLGDIVGYGADPNDCIALVAEHAALSLAGNHDLAVTGELSLDDFSRGAALAARWTREVLARDRMDFLVKLSTSGAAGLIGLYHASPRDPIWEYVLSALQAEACMDLMPDRVGAVGHSHVALRFTRANGEDVVGEQAEGGSTLDLSQGDWLVNPGSVGQPRDGDPRAAWMLLDVQGWTGEWRRVEYPIDEAARAIVDAGLPRSLGERLYLGQ